MRKLILSALLGATLLNAACATAPDKVQASYVSPVEYANLDCDQIRAELFKVSDRVRVVTGQQAAKHTRDTVALTVGLVVFWPALFFMIGGDKKEELAELKGEYDALDRAATAKNCPVAQEIDQAQAATHPRH
ncbi:MAG TPA: hypothetical protein VFE13_00985 [Caulobacteraceae bacterium]|jgi:hypothetical protein|nr:hypothetical protein [Caulobacteraceae bacterium]